MFGDSSKLPFEHLDWVVVVVTGRGVSGVVLDACPVALRLPGSQMPLGIEHNLRSHDSPALVALTQTLAANPTFQSGFLEEKREAPQKRSVVKISKEAFVIRIGLRRTYI